MAGYFRFMRWMLFLLLVFGFEAAYAQAGFYAFGPKAGQQIETEEQKRNAFQEQSLQKMQGIQDLLKSQQESSAKQLELLTQQNQLLTTIIQLQQQQVQQQSAQQLLQQPAAVPAAPLPVQ